MIERNYEEEMEQLLRPDGRKGVVIPKTYYEKLRSFILSALEDEDGKTLHDLLEKAHNDAVYTQTHNGDKSWFILQVKLDLEARGLVKIFVPDYNKRVNYLKITRLGQKVLRQDKVLTEFRSTVRL